MITFKVSPDGLDSYEVTAGSRDVLTWEKTGKNRVFSQWVNNQSMTEMYALAHIASRRLGLWTGTLPEFEQQCDIEPVSEDEGEADPTQSAASADD